MCTEKGSECVCVCACTCACEELSGHREAHSYLDEWLAQSLLVDFQHNVPDLLIRQAERAQENCCRDEERRESFLLLMLKSNSRLQRHISEIITPQTKLHLWHGTRKTSYLIFFFCFHQERLPGMMLVWPLTFTFTDISKRRKRVKIKDVTLKKDLTSLLGLFRLCFCCNNDN